MKLNIWHWTQLGRQKESSSTKVHETKRRPPQSTCAQEVKEMMISTKHGGYPRKVRVNWLQEIVNYDKPATYLYLLNDILFT